MKLQDQNQQILTENNKFILQLILTRQSPKIQFQQQLDLTLRNLAYQVFKIKDYQKGKIY